MGCGLCAPKAARYSAAVSPSAQSVGKAFADAKAPASVPSRPDRWRREVPKDASEAKESEGPRDGAMEVPKLPGVPAEAPPQPETSHAEPEEPAETAEARAGLAEAGRYEELQPAKQEEVRREKVKEEDSSDNDSVDDDEMEATLRSVASLTPRRNSEDGQAAAEALPQPPPERQNRSTEPKMPKVVQTARPLYEITSPLSAPLAALPQALFPNVEVSTSTQLLLLTWARWGRNACRIKREETIKEMQHRRFPRSPPPKPVPLSPQPTPRAPPRGESPAESAAESPSRLAGAAAWRAGGQLGMGTTVHSREGGSPGRAAFDLADLREEQRDSMAEQGARMKLTRGLGGSAAQAHSRGTPGFGLDTPGFPGASGAASADASVASSGVASPVTKGGQMSPWLLEAEALCEEETEDEGSPGGGGWGFEPETDTLLMLEQEILGKRGTTQAPVKDQQEEDKPVLDEDELERVEVFEESPTKKNVQGASDRLQQLAEPRPPQEPSYSAFEYVVGEKVSYYSSSHGAWMPARIVERKSRTVYIIDKQMRGCLAKVRASELVSEAEERTNHVLRAFTVLETRQRPSSAMSSTRASSRPQSPAPAATKLPVSRGKIVRHDFSDDEDD
ncbi:unnamed protein product [Effrenium voratum]|nr:unnamed protein product [Effrenium voratum]